MFLKTYLHFLFCYYFFSFWKIKEKCEVLLFRINHYNVQTLFVIWDFLSFLLPFVFISPSTCDDGSLIMLKKKKKKKKQLRTRAGSSVVTRTYFVCDFPFDTNLLICVLPRFILCNNRSNFPFLIFKCLHKNARNNISGLLYLMFMYSKSDILHTYTLHLSRSMRKGP